MIDLSPADPVKVERLIAAMQGMDLSREDLLRFALGVLTGMVDGVFTSPGTTIIVSHDAELSRLLVQTAELYHADEEGTS